MSNPGEGVGPSFRAQDHVFGIRHDISVGLAAFFYTVHQLVEPTAQLRVFHPAKSVTSSHEEASGAGTGEFGIPEMNWLAETGTHRLSRSFAKGSQHFVERKRTEQIINVIFHRRLEEADLDLHTGNRCHCLIRYWLPLVPRDDIFRVIGHDALALGTGGTGQLSGIFLIDGAITGDDRPLRNVFPVGDDIDLGEIEAVTNTVRCWSHFGYSNPHVSRQRGHR